MSKIRYTIASAIAAFLLAPTVWVLPASAATAPSTPVVRAPHMRLSLCVTTTWRSHYWHAPKTKPGERCYLTRDMWLPRTWIVFGPVTMPDGRRALLVQRPY